MFGFCNPEHVATVFTASGWTPPQFSKLDVDLDIAAGLGLDEAVVQTVTIGAVNSWLRNQPAEVISAAVACLRKALSMHVDGPKVRLPAPMWLISSEPA